jgi:hypothetical protein
MSWSIPSHRAETMHFDEPQLELFSFFIFYVSISLKILNTICLKLNILLMSDIYLSYVGCFFLLEISYKKNMFRKRLNKLLNPNFAKKILMKEGFYIQGVPKKKTSP